MTKQSITINEYLQVLPNYEFPERNILVALGSQGIESGVDAFQYDNNGEEPIGWIRRRDLAEARMWDFAAGLANISGGTRKLESRSITDKGFQVTGDDRARWQAEADRLRSKWGDGDGLSDVYDATLYWG